MFIQTEQTPNPATLKFLPGCEVLTSGSMDFVTPEEAKESSPLAYQLFGVSGVTSVFFGRDFITVTKDEMTDWPALKPSILSIIMDHFTTGQPVLFEEVEKKAPATHQESDLDTEIVKQIKELLDTHVRPAVARDGGDVTFHAYENGVVYLQMQGACSGCPSASMTLKSGVQNVLQHFIPEIQDVRAVE